MSACFSVCVLGFFYGKGEGKQPGYNIDESGREWEIGARCRNVGIE